jgi:hypothetical protein
MINACIRKENASIKRADLQLILQRDINKAAVRNRSSIFYAEVKVPDAVADHFDRKLPRIEHVTSFKHRQSSERIATERNTT